MMTRPQALLLVVPAVLLTIVLALWFADPGPPSDCTSGAHGHADQLSTVPFPSADWACTTENAAKVSKWLTRAHAWPAEGAYLDPIQGLPRMAGDRPPEMSGVLLVSEDRIGLLGRQGDFELAEALEVLAEEAAMLARADELPAESAKEAAKEATSIGLAIEQGVPAKRVGDVLRAARYSGFDELLLVFEAPPSSRSFDPIPAEVVDQVREMNASEAKDMLGDCPPLVALMESAESLDPAARAQALRERLGPAWQECDCQAPIDLVVAAKTWRDSSADDLMLATTSAVSTSWALAFVEDREGEEPWSALAPQLVAARAP